MTAGPTRVTMGPKLADMAQVLDLTREPGTGPVRRRRPVFVDLLPPCNEACPAGENVQAWLEAAQAGRDREAWSVLVRDNPFPAIHGRVCYHPCEESCNRDQLDEAVHIHAVERFLGDLALDAGWPLPVPTPGTGRRVLVVGAGPSGLSAAYHLRVRGHQVEVHDAGPVPGGMLHFGIPAYRLPRDVLEAEVDRILATGVRLVTDHKVDDLLAEQAAGQFDAVFVAIGAGVGKHVDIPARDAGRVLDAITLLHDVEKGEPPRLGRRVVVYGGGDTAMDAARTARRLGADEALVVYRRDPAHMPAHPAETAEALSEGVEIRWLRTIKGITDDELTVEEMVLDEHGWPQPTGRTETLRSDALVLALGQETDSAFLRRVEGVTCQADGTVIVGPDMMTGHPGIFAGGDMVPTERTVTTAVGHGKRAARHIDAWLRGGRYEPAPKHPGVRFAQLHLPVYSDAEPARQPGLDPERRRHTFEEVYAGLSAHDAHHEAQRCLSCGNCFECDNCYAACPEEAIVKLGPGMRYRIDLERCTGCAVCFEQCPCHAIEMVAEPAEGT
jgi:formate dehydrogenase beta subunit